MSINLEKDNYYQNHNHDPMSGSAPQNDYANNANRQWGYDQSHNQGEYKQDNNYTNPNGYHNNNNAQWGAKPEFRDGSPNYSNYPHQRNNGSNQGYPVHNYPNMNRQNNNSPYQRYKPTYTAVPKPPGFGLGVASMVLGILSLVWIWFFVGFFTAIVGLVLGVVSKRLNTEAGFQPGSMATAGIVCSVIAISIGAFAFLAVCSGMLFLPFAGYYF